MSEQKTIKINITTHGELMKIGAKGESFDHVISRLIRGHNSCGEVINKIRALSGMAQSHSVGNKEAMDQIKALENEAIQLLGV